MSGASSTREGAYGCGEADRVREAGAADTAGTAGTAWLATLERRAALRERAGLRRSVPARSPAVDLAGNDYLGLSRHPSVVGAASAALEAYGVGATGSRLVRGSTVEHAILEASLADWLGVEAALVYSSGYLANLGALRGLARPRSVVVRDAHVHASLVDGCGREAVVLPHRSVPIELGPSSVVVTESVFSVDGDLAPLAELHAVARRHGAVLLVDDAHGLGVIGPGGAGGVAAAGLSGEPDVVVTATLSKALGAAGGVVAGPAAFIRHLVDTGRTFIYDTALPPAIAAGARAAVELARAADGARAELHRRAGWARDRLSAAGLDASDPAGGVLCMTAPSAPAAVAWAAACLDRGVAVGCFRPPSTPDGRSRLRLTVNAGIARADFEKAIDMVISCSPSGPR